MTELGRRKTEDGRRTESVHPPSSVLRPPSFVFRPRSSVFRRLRLNLPLLLGAAILLVVLAAAVAPDRLAPFPPDQRGSFLQEINGVPMAPPFPPSSRYPLGSDIQARDLLSRLIYGTRTTLSVALVVAVIRITLGVISGWAAAWYPGEVRRYMLILSSASATLPSLLFAYMVVATIGPARGTPVFLVGLGLTGWAAWTQLIYSGVLRIQAMPYMQAADAVGSTTRHKIRHYLIPNLLPVVLPALAQEVAAALLILAELGFLGLYLGSTRAFSFNDLLTGEMPQLPQPEWAGMLAGTRLEIFRWWWLPLVPAGAFLVTIFGFNLLADGLRRRLDRL